jgi:hypothetical protein
LDNWEGATITWEEGLASFVRVLREVTVECDASHAHTDAIRRDFSTQLCTSSSQSRWLTDLDRTLEEC